MNGFGKALIGMIHVSMNRTIARRLSSGVTILALAGIVLLVAAGGASAKDCGNGIADCECGDTVVANWTLTGNMFCPTGHSLIVGADNITIDGAGYTIDGIDPGACGSRAGIYGDGYDDVTIRNLKVRKFCNGIFIENYAYRNTIHNCEVYDNGIDTVDAGTMGMRLIRVDDSIISNNSVHDTKGRGDGCESGGNGIYVFAGHRNLVTNNSLYDNTKSGYFTKMQPRDTNVTHNNIWGNGGCGINLMCMMSNYHIIEHNNVWENGCGIQTNGEPNTIRYNNVTNNAGRGISMAGGTVNSNIVCGNSGTDISAQSAGSVTGDDNTCDTTSNYHDGGEGGCTWLCPDVPDLVITEKSEEWIVEGLTYNITYMIKNFGKVTANASKTGIYIDDELNTTDDIPELVVGASIIHEVGPFTISEGMDTIEVCADCEYNVSESWENNNCKKNVFVCEPDIAIVEKSEEWIVEGSTYNITYTVKNIGTSKASVSKTGIYIDDILNTTDNVPELDPDASYTNTLGPFTLFEYVDTIKICADCEYNVSESLENNNCLTNVFGVADLVIAEKTEDWIVEGSTYNITYDVKNIGFAKASASKTGIYIDDVFNMADNVPELGPGDSHTATLGPFSMSGNSDTIKVCADYEGSVLEIDEDNNCMTNVLRVLISVNTSGWWRVGGLFNPSSSPIQDAVNNAVAYDFIIVKDGTYTENVNVITAHLTIQSENGSANCIVQASNSADHVFDLHSSSVHIVGFTITGANGACGIRISGNYPYCTMTNNIISDNYYGVYMSSAGIHYVFNCPDVLNSTITNNHYGIYMTTNYYRWDTEIENNVISSNTQYGVYAASGCYIIFTMRGNIVCENGDIDICTGPFHFSGYNNTCNTTHTFHDVGAEGCTWECLPDLVIVEKSEGWVVGGSTYNIIYEIKNIGTARANVSKTGIYIDDVLNRTDDVYELAVDASYNNELGPFTLTEGNDTIKVCADCEDNVTESNETNNCLENVFPACVAEDGTVYGCGDIVTKSCTLNGDMICTSGSGLIIGVDGITIDGDDYRMTGTVTPDDCNNIGSESSPCTISGIYNVGFDNVTIKNLEIVGFCTGIALAGTGVDKVCNITVNNCSIHDNGFNTGNMATHGIHACNIDGSVDVPALTITESEIYNNEGTGAACGDGGNGIFIFAGSGDKHEYCNISHNRLHNNAKAGFWTKMMLTRSEIAHNEIWGNGYGTGVSDDQRGGIVLRCKMSNENLIAHNDVHDNDVDGIFIGGSNNTIEYNNVTNNTDDGIDMGRSDGSHDNELYENTVCDNWDKDISTFGAGSNTTGDENTCDTTKDYDDTGATGCTYSCGGSAGICGDVDGLPGVTTNDGRQIFMYLLHGPEEYPLADIWAADCDGLCDGITTNDGRHIFMHLLHGAEGYPLVCC